MVLKACKGKPAVQVHKVDQDFKDQPVQPETLLVTLAHSLVIIL